jgi:hypothetical protein
MPAPLAQDSLIAVPVKVLNCSSAAEELSKNTLINTHRKALIRRNHPKRSRQARRYLARRYLADDDRSINNKGASGSSRTIIDKVTNI